MRMSPSPLGSYNHSKTHLKLSNRLLLRALVSTDLHTTKSLKTHVNLNCNLPLPFIYSSVKSSVSLLYQAIILRMQLLLQGILFSFLVITIILNQIPTSCADDDVQYLKCGSPFHCANLKNLSYPF